MAMDHEPLIAPPSRRPGNRELYIDAFRGLMALVMVQGHVCDALLTPAARAAPWYVFEAMFHGTTAPGFLFASGFVAGLPRAPIALRPRGGLLSAPAVPLPGQDAGHREPGGDGGALRLRRAAGDRGDP